LSDQLRAQQVGELSYAGISLVVANEADRRSFGVMTSDSFLLVSGDDLSVLHKWEVGGEPLRRWEGWGSHSARLGASPTALLSTPDAVRLLAADSTVRWSFAHPSWGGIGTGCTWFDASGTPFAVVPAGDGAACRIVALDLATGAELAYRRVEPDDPAGMTPLPQPMGWVGVAESEGENASRVWWVRVTGPAFDVLSAPWDDEILNDVDTSGSRILTTALDTGRIRIRSFPSLEPMRVIDVEGEGFILGACFARTGIVAHLYYGVSPWRLTTRMGSRSSKWTTAGSSRRRTAPGFRCVRTLCAAGRLSRTGSGSAFGPSRQKGAEREAAFGTNWRKRAEIRSVWAAMDSNHLRPRSWLGQANQATATLPGTVLDAYDDVLTHPDGWDSALGLDHDPAEPTTELLPGRVDTVPAPDYGVCCAVGQFDSARAGAKAADAVSGVCVSRTVIVPGLPLPELESDNHRLTDALEQLRALGAKNPFIGDADTGYLQVVDIRADFGTHDRAIDIGRQLARVPSPFDRGLIPPWAPGNLLMDAQVRARLYLAALGRVDRTTREYIDRPPRDRLEHQLHELWRRYVDEQNDAVRNYLYPDRNEAIDASFERANARFNSYRDAFGPFLGAERQDSHWFADYQLRVEDRFLCLGHLWFVCFASAFPTCVAWLAGSGAERADYSLYNFMRP